MYKQHSRALIISSVIGASLAVLALAIFGLRSAYAAAAADAPLPLLEPSPRDEVQAAWRQARDSGAYDFSADMVQRTVPLPKVTNVGRGSKEETYYLEGHNNTKDASLLFSIRTDGGDLTGAPAEIEGRIEDGRAFLRQGGGDWEEVDDFSAVMAPEGDFLGYLVAIKDVAFLGEESRAGIGFTRYGFQLDGPRFAAYMRDELQKEMARKGELPAGMSLDFSRQYVEMVGSGELWIDAAGFPLRQILHLRFPDTGTDYLEAEVDVTFTGFGQPAVEKPLVSNELVEQAESVLSWMLVMLVPFGFVALLIARSQSRRLYGALAILLVVSMVVSPMLQSARAKELGDRQAERARESASRAEEEQSQAEQWQSFLIDSRQAAMRLLAKRDAPQAETQRNLSGGASALGSLREMALALSRPVESQAADPVPDPAGDDDGDGLTNAEEAELGTDPLDPDSDDDGLTDFEERELGTKPLYYDSDYDLITDTLEVRGFEYPADSGQWWYPDPLNMDSNGDGLPDTAEWHGDGEPLDTDGDGTPDLFDGDNDGDGVPDSVDLSPDSLSDPQQPYGEDRPFELSIEGLEADRPTYVDFQIRPVNPDHLWYAYNVLDWPHDEQGPIQDTTDNTFADLPNGSATNGDDGSLAGPVAYNGDLRLLPMLEIRVSGEEDILPSDQDLRDLYGGVVMDLPAADGVAQKAVYIPLQLMSASEQDGAEKVAFFARMLYQPGETWHTQSINVVWLIQALLDYCAEYDDAGQICLDQVNDEPQVIQVYPDDWYLTGLNIQENRGYNAAVIWEDPAVDDNVQVDGALYALPLVLDEVFLTPRDEDGDGQRDVDVAELQRRLDYTLNADLSPTERWGITRTLRVHTGSYDHPDIGQYQLALMTNTYTTTATILEDYFGEARPVTPTLLYATEQSIRFTNLDDAGWVDGWEIGSNQGITITMSALPEEKSQEQVAVRKQSYCYDEGRDAWTACS
ncbi:MAG: hypothetical protein PVH65_15180, partial [Chloroflexota bacterium]